MCIEDYRTEPGDITLPTVDTAAAPLPGEHVFLMLLATALTVTWFGVALAQLGRFSAFAVIMLSAAVLVPSSLYLLRHQILRRPVFDRQHAIFGVLCGIAVALFAQPSEHYPLLGDSAIYPNTGALLARTAELTFAYAPFEGLTAEEKRLFYVPSDKQIPGIVVEGYQGLLFGAYYLIDTSVNTLVSSRPAGFVVWTGLAFALFGNSAVFLATPFFGVIGVLAVYLVGARLHGYWVGILGAFFLAVSFPQIYFARTPYAEAMAQALVWGGLYCLVTYFSRRSVPYLLVGAASFGAAILTRVDALAVIAPTIIFVLILVTRKDARGAAFFLTCMLLVMTAWWVNATSWLAPYVISSYQLFSTYVFSFLQYWPWLAVSSIAAAVLLSLVLFQYGGHARGLARRVTSNIVVRWAFAMTVLGVMLYLYFVQSEGQPAQAVVPPNDILPQLAKYITPFLLGAGVLGYILCFWRGVRAQDAVIMVFSALFSALFLVRYTSAAVYPVALRRLAPEVIPAILLFASYFIVWALTRPVWRQFFPRMLRVAQVSIIALIVSGLLAASIPYLIYQEARETTHFMATLADMIPSDAFVIFEPVGDASQVGWMACPLWSVYGRNALLLTEPTTEPSVVKSVVSRWALKGRPVYFVSEHNPPPDMVKGINYALISESRWNSSIIGQSRNFFPPYIWRFEMPFFIFQLS